MSSCPFIELDKCDNCASFWCARPDEDLEDCPICLVRPTRLETTVLACGHVICRSCHQSLVDRTNPYSQHCSGYFQQLQGDSCRIGFPEVLDMPVPCDEGDEVHYLKCGLLTPSPPRFNYFCIRCPLCRLWARAFQTPSWSARGMKTTRQRFLNVFTHGTLWWTLCKTRAIAFVGIVG